MYTLALFSSRSIFYFLFLLSDLTRFPRYSSRVLPCLQKSAVAASCLTKGLATSFGIFKFQVVVVPMDRGVTLRGRLRTLLCLTEAKEAEGHCRHMVVHR